MNLTERQKTSKHSPVLGNLTESGDKVLDKKDTILALSELMV